MYNGICTEHKFDCKQTGTRRYSRHGTEVDLLPPMLLENAGCFHLPIYT